MVGNRRLGSSDSQVGPPTAAVIGSSRAVKWRKAMMLELHREQTLSDLFVAYLLVQNIRYQEDLVDQHCNSSEKRLARILLSLAKKNTSDSVVAKLDQTTLAQMVGTTRSRVSFFMNKFRSLGLIDYSDFGHGLQIHGSLFSLYGS
jgi:CRP/FNR family cyclic AMP-dependent transcriptional regulator